VSEWCVVVKSVSCSLFVDKTLKLEDVKTFDVYQDGKLGLMSNCSHSRTAVFVVKSSACLCNVAVSNVLASWNAFLIAFPHFKQSAVDLCSVMSYGVIAKCQMCCLLRCLVR